MNRNNSNHSIIFSCIALAFSVVTIILFFIKVTPESIVDSNTFISVLAAFIGISVTLLIGYQVYNAVEIKQELAKIDSVKKELEKAQAKLDDQKQEVEKKWKSLKNEMEMSRCISLSRIDAEHNPIMAFIRLHEALQYILSSDNQREDVDWYQQELSERMAHIDKSCFALNVADKIQELKDCYKNDMETIMSHKNYYIIQNWYSVLMEEFEKHLDNIAKAASDDDIEPFSSHTI